VRALLKKFVPAADEVGRLQRGKDPESLLFQKAAEQGHYAGRTVPTNTRQGLYAMTPDGHLLGSINHNDPERVADMLERAWISWVALSAAKRKASEGWDGVRDRQRLEDRYPTDGLVLRVTSRDLEREGAAGAASREDWRAKAWNLDYAWLRAAEAAAFVPAKHELGATRELEGPSLDRLARVSLVDNVRGQTYPAPKPSVERARLTCTITAVDGARVTLALEGEARWEQRGTWHVGGRAAQTATQRGIEARLLGSATWDAETKRFVAFELLAVGTRWGGTQYNGRHDDLDPQPIGFLFELASDAPHEHVVPAGFWEYGW